MKILNSLSLFVLAAVLLPATSDAQTLLTPTTLSTAITDSKGKTFVVASATGFTANTTVAVIDRELVAIEAVSSTTITVRRGAAGTVGTTHASGALVFVGPPGAFAPTTTTTATRVDQNGNPAGSCTRTNVPYLPVINLRTATVSDCLGGVWVAGAPYNSGSAQQTRFRIVSPEPGNVALTALNTNGTTLGATTLYCTEVFVPSNKLVTGIGVLNGTTVGTDNHYVVLYDSGGTAIANSALAGALAASASAYQEFAFTAKYYTLGPAQYFACFQTNGNTATVRMSITAFGDTNMLTKGQTGATFGTVPALTVPTTYTTAVGPYVYLY